MPASVPTGTVSIREIDGTNFRQAMALDVTDAQREWVASTCHYLTVCAYGETWHPLGLYAQDAIVGFAMWALDPADGSHWIGGFLIDGNHQGRGYGRAGMTAVLDWLRARGATHFALSYAPGNEVARRLYHSIGFAETEEREGNEIVARLDRGTAPTGGWRDPTKGYAVLVERLSKWASDQDDVAAAIIVGSRARAEQPADEWSDLDVALFASDPSRYTRSPDWLTSMGDVWLSFTERTAVGDALERRVLFAGWLDVDFAVLPTALLREWSGSSPPADVASVLQRGVSVLVDKDGLVDALRQRPPPASPLQRPEQAEFDELTADFWYHVVWSAKHLRRGELWWAKSGIDGHLKGILRVMLEWHARASGTSDTWMAGRFLEQWADPRAVDQLHHAFGRYERADLWSALRHTAQLFAWLTRETRMLLDLRYDSESAQIDEKVVNRLGDVFPELEQPPPIG